MTRLTSKTSKSSPIRHRGTSNRHLLLRRLEHFSFNNNIDDLDSCVDYLRHNYKNDYGRLKFRLFSKLVDDSIRDLKQQQKNRSLKSPSHRESRLQSQEEDHSRRLQCGGTSRRADASSSDESVHEECSDDPSEGENRVDLAYRGPEESSGDQELQSRKMRKKTKSIKDKVARLRFGSESADEDEVIEPDSGFNLLNASLCSTYTINRSNNSSHDSGEEPLDIPKEDEHGKQVTILPEAEKAAAFASPSAIIAAARAAHINSLKKHDKVPSNNSLNASLMDAEDTGGQSAIVQESNEKRAINSKGTNASKVVDSPTVENGRAEKTGLKKRTRQSDDQGKDRIISTAEAVRFSDLGGIDSILESLREIMFPLYNPAIYSWLGVEPIRGILLYGPPGCGKTKLANAIAFEAGLPFLKISGPEVVSGMSGESEAKIRSLFTEAIRLAPSVIFIDEIDSITSKRENAHREMERRIVTQLMTCMDELNQSFQKGTELSEDSIPATQYSKHVLVVGATNRPETLDPALRRPGRFDREISLGVPDENARAQILSVLAKHLRLDGTFDFKHIARCTPGFVGADLAALTREAGSIAIKRIVSARNPDAGLPIFKSITSTADLKEDACSNIDAIDSCVNGSDSRSLQETSWWKTPWSQEEMQSLSITMQDFEEAVTLVQPSTKREGFSTIPNVKWEDVGALDSIQNMMEFFISRRIKHPEDYEELGLEMDTGFLLYGPPGCGKTLVAKAVANDAQANFIYIKGPELLNKYVGESEQAVRALFSRARSCAPCILFFDEMDALAPRRGTDGNAVAERVLNQLLSEMDGAEKRRGVFMIGATNRPDMIDPAVLRPGRLGKMLYVPLPDVGGRLSILKTLTRQKPVSSDVDLVLIASNKQCEGLSGADLAALVNEACVAALQEKCSNRTTCEPLSVCKRHFDIALSQIFPSVSRQDLIYYEALPKKFSRITMTKAMKGIASGQCI